MTTFEILEHELRMAGVTVDDVTLARLQRAARSKQSMGLPPPTIARKGNILVVTVAADLAEDAIQSAKKWVLGAAKPHPPEE